MADDFDELIVSDAGVMLGKPGVAGTRVTVESILEKLAAGQTMEQLLASPLGSRPRASARRRRSRRRPAEPQGFPW